MKLHQTIIVLGMIIAFGSLDAQSPGPSAAISAERIKTDVRVLSSDEFLGRGPGEGGEEKAIKYIADALAASGVEAAGENRSWFQDVPLVRLDRQPGAKLSLKIG